MLPIEPVIKVSSEVKITCGVCGKEVVLKQIEENKTCYKEVCECKNEWLLQRLY